MGSGGPRGLQNRSGLTTSGWVGSIPTRSRHRLALALPHARRFGVRALRSEAAGDELARYAACESRRRPGVATASNTRDEIAKRGVRIPSEYAGDQRDMVCGLIVVWTR